MYEVSDIQEYRQKWLEAERALAINWVEVRPIENVDKEMEPAPKSPLPPRNLEDYQPGATQARVFEALKKVAKSRKSSREHVEPPATTS